MSLVSTFQERFGKLKESESDKNELIENLLTEVKELSHSLTEKELHLEREQDTAIRYQQRYREAETELKKQDRNAFVLVLIDGDCMQFIDDLVKSAAESGGQDAAQRLRTEVSLYVTEELDLAPNIDILVQVYANVKGLAKTYCENKIVEGVAQFELFVRGFNVCHPLCDFVDVGSGKECADDKLKATFKLFVGNVHCKSIIFGGSADNGYARLLRQYTGDKSISNRITLLEGPPFARELSVLKNKFRTTSFPQAFRDTKIPSRRVSFSMTPPSSPSPISPSTYASTVGVSNGLPNITAGTPPATNDPHAAQTRIFDMQVLKNSKGQRIDSKLQPRQSLVAAQRRGKVCNEYHILGECSFAKCSYLHGVRLGDREIEARRFIARESPCSIGLGCDDSTCLLGHSCPKNGCHGRDGCRFPREMHGIART